MKRTLVLVLILVLTLTLTDCGRKTGEEKLVELTIFVRMEWERDHLPAEGFPERLWVEFPAEHLLFLKGQ